MSMVDVDCRMNANAHFAGLKRLSARAANKGPTCPSSLLKACFSFRPFARNVIEHLNKCQIEIAKGLSDQEFAKIEATFGFTFPPELKAVLQEGLPVGLGFPDWRSTASGQLRVRMNLPILGLSYEVARGAFWTKQWGPRPANTQEAICIARSALRKVPILVPVYNNCYISSWPNLAGNPVFFVFKKDVVLCGHDLADFFVRQAFAPQSPEVSLEIFETKSSVPACRGISIDFADMNFSPGRAVSFGSWSSQTAENFRTEEPIVSFKATKSGGVPNPRPDLMEANSSRQEEVSECKCEEPRTDPGSWNKNLDAQSHGHLLTRTGRPKCSVNGRNNHRRFRSSDLFCNILHSSSTSSKDLGLSYRKLGDTADSRNSFVDFSNDEPSSAAKIARRIEFWSDLVEKKQNSTGNGSTGKDLGLSSSKIEVDSERASSGVVECKDGTLVANSRDNCSPKWLKGFLENLATILRNGSWKEDDITEMLGASSKPEGHDNIFLDKQARLEGLILHVTLVTDALRRAGWTAKDVAEALDVGLALEDHHRQPTKISNQLTARIGKLAQYVVQSSSPS